MTTIGSIVTVRGRQYRVTTARNLSSCGSKFFGKFAFELTRVEDGTKWEAFGKSVAYNSRLLELPNPQ